MVLHYLYTVTRTPPLSPFLCLIAPACSQQLLILIHRLYNTIVLQFTAFLKCQRASDCRPPTPPEPTPFPLAGIPEAVNLGLLYIAPCIVGRSTV